MPRTPVNYSKAVIYQICCKDLSVKDLYVGSTTNLANRRHAHKSKCHNEKCKDYTYPVYQFIRDHGGFDNWEIIKVHDAPVNCSEDLHKLERECMERLGATLNKQVPNRSHREYNEGYRESNKDRIREKSKGYREANKDRIREKSKGYQEANKDTIREKQKGYRELNKTELARKHKQYREANKMEIAQKAKVKVTCQCGAVVTKGNIASHRKSNKHQHYLATHTEE